MKNSNSNAPTTMLDIGYIYKITSNEDDKIYYGSSKDVKQREWSHNSIFNACMTQLIYGYKRVSVIEKLYNISRYDLKLKEKEYIENHNEEESGLLCLNRNVPTQTESEYHKNSKMFAAKQKLYYYQNHKKELARNKKYRKGKTGDTWMCVDCNQLLSWTSKRYHLKSIKHLQAKQSGEALNCVAAASSAEGVTLKN